MAVVRIVALEGDETGQELLEQSLRVLDPEGADDVGSPNRILCEGVDGKVIVRTGRRIPG